MLGILHPTHGFFAILFPGVLHVFVDQIFKVRGILRIDNPVEPTFRQTVHPALIVNLQFIPQQQNIGQFFFEYGFGQFDDFGICSVNKAKDGFIQIFGPSAYFVELIHD